MKFRLVVPLIVGVILLGLLSACATVSQQELQAANFGPYPASYETDIKNLMSRLLKDPYSANYRFGTPRKGFAQDGLLMGGAKHFGYIIPVYINAKNSFGGYTGEQLHYLLISEGKVNEITQLFNVGMAKYLE